MESEVRLQQPLESLAPVVPDVVVRQSEPAQCGVAFKHLDQATDAFIAQGLAREVQVTVGDVSLGNVSDEAFSNLEFSYRCSMSNWSLIASSHSLFCRMM